MRWDVRGVTQRNAEARQCKEQIQGSCDASAGGRVVVSFTDRSCCFRAKRRGGSKPAKLGKAVATFVAVLVVVWHDFLGRNWQDCIFLRSVQRSLFLPRTCRCLCCVCLRFRVDSSNRQLDLLCSRANEVAAPLSLESTLLENKGCNKYEQLVRDQSRVINPRLRRFWTVCSLMSRRHI